MMTHAAVTGMRGARAAGWEWGAVLVSWLAYSVLTAPIPAVNEPHYLTKARHFVQPDWCAGDLFLASSNAHVVFYTVFGPLTTFLTLTQVAWIGRLCALGIVATGWCRLRGALQLPVGAALPAAWLFLLLQGVGNFSGEWVIGGLESKVCTYGLWLWGLAAVIQQRPLSAGLLCGAAIALHPVVGLWGLLAACGAGLLVWWTYRREPLCQPSLSRWLMGGLLLILAALPGIVPVLPLIFAGVDPQTKYAGTYLQVFYRLGHHLDPMRIPLRAWLGYGVLTGVWVCGWWWIARMLRAEPVVRRRSVLWLQGIVLCALLFAVGGVLAGYGPRPPQEMPGFAWRMQLLKFYPFRLYDAVLPMGVAWLFTAGGLMLDGGMLRRNGGFVTGLLVCLTVSLLMWQRSHTARAADDMPAWLDVCRWVRESTPADSLFYTPHGRFTFKWYAARAEYVNYKDCPQDVVGIVEWNRRMQFLKQWFQTHYADQRYTAEELAALAQETGITHLLTDRLGPIDLLPLYQNGTYRVYDLRAPQ